MAESFKVEDMINRHPDYTVPSEGEKFSPAKFVNRWSVAGALLFGGLVLASGEVAVSSNIRAIRSVDLEPFRFFNLALVPFAMYAGGSLGYLLKGIWSEGRFRRKF